MTLSINCFSSRLIALAVILFSLRPAHAEPIVSNLTAGQRPGTKLVDITYDLIVTGWSSVTVSLEVSSDAGVTWTVPVFNVGGAIGANVAPGVGKSIVWDAGTDWPRNYSSQMRFRVTAEHGFALIPGGSFTMGRTSGDTDSDAPSVTVTVNSFFLQEKETTKAQWDEVLAWGASKGYTDLPTGAGKGPDHPVQKVSWFDVLKWCNARSEREGLTAVYTLSGAVMRTGQTIPTVNWNANGYRLPTEAEWEKAARGGVEGKRFSWGTDTINHSNANYIANSAVYSYDTSGNTSNTYHPAYMTGSMPYTAPVGSFGANGFGLHDMAGNIQEWCWDWYEATSYTDGAINPRGPASGSNRVIRGGGWQNGAPSCRAAARGAVSADNRNFYFGFRPARTLAP